MGKLKRNKQMKPRAGQSLIEILIALAVGGMLIGTAATLMAVVLRVSSQNLFLRTAASLNEELMEKVTAYAERQWYCAGSNPTCGVYNLGRYTNYYLQPNGVRFEPRLGTETITVDGVPYTRRFWAKNVCRNGDAIAGPADSADPCNFTYGVGAVEDPSTQQVVARTWWIQSGAQSSLLELTKYLTRARNVVFRQSDWSGGAAPSDPPATTPTNRFHSAESVNVSVAGELQLVP